MNPDLSHVRRDILRLFGIAIGAGLVFVFIIAPLIFGVTLTVSTPWVAGLYLAFAVLLALVLLAGVYFYLAPIAELAAVRGMGEALQLETVQKARTLAFSAPLYFLYLPVLATFFVAASTDIVGGILLPDYTLEKHFPITLAVTVVSTSISLIVSVVSRRILAPVLSFTSGLAEDIGPRFNIRTRYLVTTLLLLFIAVIFVSVLFYQALSLGVRYSLRNQYRQIGAVIREFGADMESAAVERYVSTLNVADGMTFLLDVQGQFVTPIPSTCVADCALLRDLFAAQLAHTSGEAVWDVAALQGEVLLIPLHRSDFTGWLGFFYRIRPLHYLIVGDTALVFLLFLFGLTALIVVVNRYIADDTTRDMQDICVRLHGLADGKGKGFEKLNVMSLDEVGDLVIAFNDLLWRVQAQQLQLEREQIELRALLEISRDISYILDTDQLLSQIVLSVEGAFKYRNIVIFMLDEAAEQLYVAACSAPLRQLLQSLHCKIDETSIVGKVGLYGKPLFSHDAAEGTSCFALGACVRSELAVPMVVSGRIVGVFNVGSETPGAFSDRDQRVVTAIANQAAVALHNAQLYREVKEERQKAATLTEIAKTINSTLDLDQVLNLALEQLSEVISYDSASILLLEGEELVIAAGKGFQDIEKVKGRRFHPDERNLGYQVMLSQQVLVAPDVQALPDWGHARDDVEGAHTIRSWIGAPLVVKGSSLGLLTLDKFDLGFYRSRDAVWVSGFAEQIAVAVHNARLYQTTEARAREFSLLHTISQRISALMDMRDLFREVVALIEETCDYSIISIHLIDETSGEIRSVAQAGSDELSDLERLVYLGSTGIVAWVAAHGETVNAPDVSQDRRYLPFSPRVRSELAIPLKSGEKTIGVFNLESDRLNAFGEDTVHLMTALAHQIAVAVQNARLFADVRDRKEALADLTARLTNEKSRLRAILHNIADGLLVTDPVNDITLVNSAFEALMGQSPGALLGRALRSVISDPQLLRVVECALQTPDSTFTAEILMPDRRTFKASAAAIREETLVLGVVTVIRDVTHEKAVDQMKTEFISTVSHELRTPLTAVLGFAKLIGKTLDRDVTPVLHDKRGERALKRAHENLDIIVTEAERLTHLINDVLDISKMESGKLKWKDAAFDLEALLKDVAALMKRDVAARSLTFTLHLEDDLPFLYADQERLRQVVLNLFSNAFKFTTHGEVGLWARRVRPGETFAGWEAPAGSHGAVLIAVTDTGVGIPPESLPLLFNRFQQLSSDALTDRPKGTGLGLAICREIVTHYGGAIWAESTPNIGSRFSFVLPIQAPVVSLPVADGGAHSTGAPLIAAARRRTENETPAAAGSARSTILVVDDEAHLRSMLAQELSEAGYQVLEAGAGAEAIALARHHMPALILLDVMMPDLSGFDVTRILKADSRTAVIPVLMLSIIEDRERGLALGADDYLIKPVEPGTLLETISTLLQGGHPLLHEPLTVASPLEALTEALYARGFEVEAAYDSREGKKPLPLSLEPFIHRVLAGREVKAMQFRDAAQCVVVIVLTGESGAPEVA